MIGGWGFETVTMGIEVKVPEEQVPIAVRREIERRCDNSDCNTKTFRCFNRTMENAGTAL